MVAWECDVLSRARSLLDDEQEQRSLLWPRVWTLALMAVVALCMGCAASEVMPSGVAHHMSPEASQPSATSGSEPTAEQGANIGDEESAANYQFEGWDQQKASASDQPQTKSAQQGATAASSEQGFEPPSPTVVSYPVRDPLVRMNRAVFWFNHRAYSYALAPAARLYSQLIPQPARNGIGRFFDNLKVPMSLLNNLLQGRFQRAATNLARVSINSTLGLVGLFDPAQSWFGMPPAPAGFSGTLARWNVGAGPYLVLPLLGPADLRGASGMVGDALLNPIPYLLDQPESTVVVVADSFQDAAPLLPTYEQIYAQAEDPYVFFRNFYVQGRKRNMEYGPGFISGAAFGVGADAEAATASETGL